MTAPRPRLGRARSRAVSRTVHRLRSCVPGCSNGPNPIFCEHHWPLVTGATRRKLVAAWKVVQAGQRMAGPELADLLVAAITEVQTALYRAGATPTPEQESR